MASILLVEDDKAIIENLTEFLAAEGFQVKAVSGQSQAVGLLEEEIFLSALEYRLLLVFFNNKGVLLSRDRLLEEIWDVAGEFVNDNTLTVYIKRLREKIEEDPAKPRIIQTVRGMGYRVC